MTDRIAQTIRANRQPLLQSWMQWLRIPSISAQPEHAADMTIAAEWLCGQLRLAGLTCELRPTAGHPAVLASRQDIPSGPTVLMYGHYDVQPVGDPSLWQSPPFEPTIRDEAVFARGSADNKGPVLTMVAAVQAWLATTAKLPINVTFLIEGEEEIGSPHLPELLRARREELACDLVLICDTGQFQPGLPAITYGTKGLVYKELILTGPKKDLHSGGFGGTVANPANVLAEVLAAMKGRDGRVTIPGFYDAVRPLSPQERPLIEGLPFDDSEYLAELGSPCLEGEPGYSTLERRWARPTFDVNGMHSGYTGPGAATIIPAQATAKISMRLVPDQDPAAISAAFDRVVHQVCNGRVRVQIIEHGLCRAYLAPPEGPWIQAGRRAIRAGFGCEPVLVREGGTLPILPMFREVLGAESLLLGYCHPNCNAHSPNEFFGISDFLAGAISNACLFGELAGAARGGPA